MSEQWVDFVEVYVRGYDGFPLPENLDEVLGASFEVGRPIDRSSLFDEIKTLLQDQPHNLDEYYRSTDWGGGGANLQFFIEGVAAGITANVIVGAIKAVVRRYAHSEMKRGELDHEMATRIARSWVATAAGVPEQDVDVSLIEIVEGGQRLTVETPHGAYSVDISDGVPSRLKRVNP